MRFRGGLQFLGALGRTARTNGFWGTEILTLGRARKFIPPPWYGGGMDGPPPPARVFDMLQYFETNLPGWWMGGAARGL